MELVNQTMVPATLLVAQMSDEDCRGGVLIAKATFDVPEGGAPRLVSEDPMPLLTAPAPLDDMGQLPVDVVPREDPAFEVFLLGACHAAGGKPVQQRRVSMSVGSVSHELLVTGDRVWEGQGAGARISAPAVFTRIPLTYERAFGGSAEIQIDPDSLYPVFDPVNPKGLGFDPTDYAAGCAAEFECPPGFPALAPTPRRVPNVEDPRTPIRAWGDHPEPACWAPIPMDIGFGLRSIEARKKRYGSDPTPAQQVQASYFRAHPDWIFDAPPAARAAVRVEGVSPGGPIAFALPELRVLADYAVGQRQGTFELSPQALIILAEKRRFCVVYRLLFRFPRTPGVERSLRVRLAEGWRASAAPQPVYAAVRQPT